VTSVVLWILFEFNEKIHFASVLFVFLVSILCARSGFVGSLWISCPVRVHEQFSGALFRACPNPFFAALVFLSAQSQLLSATGVLIFFGLSLHRPTCFSRLISHSRFALPLDFSVRKLTGTRSCQSRPLVLRFSLPQQECVADPSLGPICFLISVNRSPAHRSIFSPA
jgi:hypothetical protein